jgi:hypothetical protein
VADGVARQCFFEGSGAQASFGDGGGVLQHGGVKGGEGGQLNEEEVGRRVGFTGREWCSRGGGSPAKFRRGEGVPVLEHPLDGVVVLRGLGGCARAAGVWSRKEGG